MDQFISALDVVPFDRQATAAYGRLRAALEKKGQSIGSMDLVRPLLAIPRAIESSHLLIMGDSGTSKSALIRQLLTSRSIPSRA